MNQDDSMEASSQVQIDGVDSMGEKNCRIIKTLFVPSMVHSLADKFMGGVYQGLGGLSPPMETGQWKNIC